MDSYPLSPNLLPHATSVYTQGMSRILIRIFTAFLVLISTSPTFGWGGDGHKIVGKIASKHVTSAETK